MASIADLTKVWGGEKSSFEVKTASAEETFRCPWSDRVGCRSDLLQRAHSDYSGLKCFKVDVEPYDEPDISSGGPKQAMLTAYYKPENKVNAEDPEYSDNLYVESWQETWEFGVEAITLGGSGWVWSDDEKPLKEDTVSAIKLFPTAQINVTGAYSEQPSKTAVAGVIGRVNNGAWKSFGDQTLLFTGLTAGEQTDAEGNGSWQITYRFAWKPEGWNKFYKKQADPPGFVLVHQDGDTGVRPYDTAAFSDLSPNNW